jgi:hypothetical protein
MPAIDFANAFETKSAILFHQCTDNIFLRKSSNRNLVRLSRYPHRENGRIKGMLSL